MEIRKKYFFITLIIALSFFSLKPNYLTKETIIGYWYYCDTVNNDYWEIYFLNDSSKVYLDLIHNVHYKYTIKNDTLFFGGYNCNIFDYFQVIESIDKNTLILSKDGRKFFFSRIREEIKYDINFSLKERDLYHDNLIRRSRLYCDY